MGGKRKLVFVYIIAEARNIPLFRQGVYYLALSAGCSTSLHHTCIDDKQNLIPGEFSLDEQKHIERSKTCKVSSREIYQIDASLEVTKAASAENTPADTNADHEVHAPVKYSVNVAVMEFHSTLRINVGHNMTHNYQYMKSVAECNLSL